jgi:hypothetical protein
MTGHETPMTDELSPESGPFSPDYRSARDRFRTHAAAAGFRLEAYSIGQEGPSGEELTIDAAILGDERPERAVVVSSGMHGVEGFFGSAVQLRLLQGLTGGWSPPPGTALVLLHSLDPYGFAWIRRVNEDNVDLNRNFLVNGDVYAGSPPRYGDLNRLLNPEGEPRRIDLFWPRALWSIVRHGMPEMKQAVAGGQYDYPRGLFFGGNEPSRTLRILAENLSRWAGETGPVTHVDFHTGLGPWASYQILLDPGLGRERYARLEAQFGLEHVQVSEPNGIAYDSKGSLGTWCQALHPGGDYDVLCAEFGTYSALRVLSALRAENQAHHWAAPDSPAAHQAKRDLLEAFVPADPQWRAWSVASGIGIIRSAIQVSLDAPVEVLGP